MAREQETELRQKLSSDLINQVVAIRHRRRVVEERWLRARRAWMNSDLERHYTSTDTSPNDYNIPMGRRSAERTAVRGIKLLNPKTKWFEVMPVGNVSSSKVSNVDNFMSYVLRKKIKTRTNISQLVRSMVIYERSFLKTAVKLILGKVWPTQRPVDPFSLYLFPETVTSIDEAEIVFEDYLLSYNRYTSFVKSGMVEDINKSDIVKPDWPYHLVERLAYQGITDPTADVADMHYRKVSDDLDNIGASFLSMTEMWIYNEDSLYQVYIVWNLRNGAKVVGFVKSLYDEPLYRGAVHRPLPNELYTNSMMDDIVDLSTLANDQLNRFQDAVDFEQGFIGVNDSEISRIDSLKIKGRALWHFKGDPREHIQLFSPQVSSTNQLRAWQIYLGLINSLGGTGTIAEGQPGRNMPRAGSAVNNLIDLGLSDIQDVAEIIEQEILTLALGDIYKVSARFIPDSQLILIPGGQGLTGAVIKKEDIIGDYEFEWVGSLQFQDENIQAQRMMVFLNLMPQIEPFLQRQGYTMNAVELVKNIWRNTLGQRGLEQIIVPMQQQPQQQPQNLGDIEDVKSNPALQPSVSSPTNGFYKQSVS